MKNFNVILALGILAIFTYSCEDVLNTSSDSDIAEQLEGQWKCDETSTYFKSGTDFKSVERIYYVNIFISGNDSTIVHIDNFYELGNNIEARAEVNGNSITLKNEEIGNGFTVRGTGTISSNLKTITWLYYVNDGSDDEDEVSATYTYVY